MTLYRFAGVDAQFRPPAGMTGVPGPLFGFIRDQRVAFLIVGGMNTAIGAVWFILFLWLLPQGTVGYLSALLGSKTAAVLSAFVLYRRFVFRVSGHVLRDLARFELVNLSNAERQLRRVTAAGGGVRLAGAAVSAGHHRRNRCVHLVCSPRIFLPPEPGGTGRRAA